MTHSSAVPSRPELLDRLTACLLECGGVLSQIVAGMAEFEAAGGATADTMPIPEAAHAIVLSALEGIANDYSRRDMQVAARIVESAAAVIARDVFIVDPEWLASPEDDDSGAA